MVGAAGTPSIGRGRLSVLGPKVRDETDETYEIEYNWM